MLFASRRAGGEWRQLCLGLETDRPTLDAVAQRLMDRGTAMSGGASGCCGWTPAISSAPAPEQAECIRRTLEGPQARPAVPARAGGAGHHRPTSR